MLFQPTNIIPDLKGAIGNGTVDVSNNLTVSWQLNGNSPMVSYSVTIYENDSASTQKYTTGKIASNCPFDPYDRNGNQQTFSHVITNADLSDGGVTNGNEYKIVIVQWWGAEDSESVVQTSASVFKTRESPTLSLSVTSPVETKSKTFSATYSQSNNDALSWVRWKLAYSDDKENPIFDSGALYTNVTEIFYDGLFTGKTYAVKCLAETVSGVDVETAWAEFYVSYATENSFGTLSTKKGKYGSVFLEWSKIQYIMGDGSEYSISDHAVDVQSTGHVTWDAVNGESMNMQTPWTFVWNGSLVTSADSAPLLLDADLFAIETEDYFVEARYRASTKKLTLLIDDENVLEVSNMDINPTDIWIMVTPAKAYIRSESASLTGSVLPSASLYPGAGLYPNTGISVPVLQKASVEINYTQKPIKSIVLHGPQRCRLVNVLQCDAAQSAVTAIYDEGTYLPSYDEKTAFLADFANGLNAGNIAVEEAISGYAIYRKLDTEGILKHIANVSLNETSMYDFSAGSRLGEYTYYMFPIGPTTYSVAPLVSNTISICISAWVLVSCKKSQTDENLFIAEKCFSFGKNLESVKISNNNAPNVLQNFTRFPTVQKASPNYRSGSLSSLIGMIGYDSDGKFTYWNTKRMMDAVFELSTTENSLFLHSPLGDFMQISVYGEIGMTIENNGAYTTTVSFPWVETGDTDKCVVIAYDIDGIDNV